MGIPFCLILNCLVDKLHIGVMCCIYEPMIKNKFRIDRKDFIHFRLVMKLLRISG